MSETRATYFSVDLESNGPVPGLYDMVSLGAVVVAPDATGNLVTGATFYREIKLQAPRIDSHAVGIHGLQPDYLAEHGIDRSLFCEELAAWVKAHILPGTEPVFVGHNAPFDWSFVAWTFAAEELENPFGYKALCTKALATGALGLHWLDSNKETLTERLGVSGEDMSQKHRADYDAEYQAEILIALLQLADSAG